MGGGRLDPGPTGKAEWEAEFDWAHAAFPGTDRHPVVHVSWNDAREFCLWVSRKEGREWVAHRGRMGVCLSGGHYQGIR